MRSSSAMSSRDSGSALAYKAAVRPEQSSIARNSVVARTSSIEPPEGRAMSEDNRSGASAMNRLRT